MAAQLIPALVFQGTTGSGAPLVAGQLFSYAAGTTTPQATYVDSTQTTPNTNPVILNSLGQANVWLNPTLAYKFVLQDSAGNVQYTVDNILGAVSAPNVVIGPPAAGTSLRVNGSLDGATALVVAQTVPSIQPTAAITAGTTAGQSKGLLISAGTNAADYVLRVSNAALANLGNWDGTGALIVGIATGQGFGTINAQNGYYINNVKQPTFAAPLAGFGTPTGNVVVPNFSGAAATLVQCSNTIAQILLTLKAAGIYAA